jgi:hypothetical protein
LQIVKEIISRIPATSFLHLVFTRQLQNEYFVHENTGNYFDWSAGRFDRFVFAKVESGENGSLSEIVGLPTDPNNASCLVLFVIVK